MGSYFGKEIHISIFGQSHAECIGVTIDGLPAGEAVDEEALRAFMLRRAPGRSAESTARREADEPHIICGLHNGRTCGAPLTAIIKYALEGLRQAARPSAPRPRRPHRRN